MIKIHAFHILKFSSEIDINISGVVYIKTVYSSRPPSLSLCLLYWKSTVEKLRKFKFLFNYGPQFGF